MNYKEILDKIEKLLDKEALLGNLLINNSSAFKILIATILSARTRDTTTEKVTEILFNKYNSPEKIAKADIKVIQQLIRQSGFYKEKSKRIKEVSRIIHEDYNSKVPSDFDKLVKLPGVGPKTANCVLVFAFNIPALAVDTHMHRISNRIGWVVTKTPKQTELELKKKIPKELWIKTTRILVRFGQQICNPPHSKCNVCPIENICPKDFSMEEEARKKRKESERRKKYN